jgi:hypothetical protein
VKVVSLFPTFFRQLPVSLCNGVPATSVGASYIVYIMPTILLCRIVRRSNRSNPSYNPLQVLLLVSASPATPSQYHQPCDADYVGLLGSGMVPDIAQTAGNEFSLSDEDMSDMLKKDGVIEPGEHS